MKNSHYKMVLSAITLGLLLTAVGSAGAAPVKYRQVVQMVDAKPGKAGTGSFSHLRLVGKNFGLTLSDGDGDGDDKKDGDEKKKGSESAAPQQDDRVIVITTEELTDEGVECDCVEDVVVSKGFPKWPFFGLGAIPLAFIPDKNPTPTPTVTPSMTPTPTPTMTPTPTPPPVPEPMTLLLFGTGLAGIGMAARKKFGKKGQDETEG